MCIVDTLNLLWKLETQNLKLSKYQAQLKTFKTQENIKEAEIELIGLENGYKDKSKALENLEDTIRKLEIQLKNKEFLFSENKDLLYRGNITDIKQLEQLNNEGQELEKEIDNLEWDTIKKLEEIDIIQENFKKIENQKNAIEKFINENMENNKVNIDKIAEKIDVLEKEIENISSGIDGKSLTLYKKIKKQKPNPIVIVKDDICGGCNMRVPSYQRQMLGEHKEIVLCESCGRILLINPS